MFFLVTRKMNKTKFAHCLFVELVRPVTGGDEREY